MNLDHKGVLGPPIGMAKVGGLLEDPKTLCLGQDSSDQSKLGSKA